MNQFWVALLAMYLPPYLHCSTGIDLLSVEPPPVTVSHECPHVLHVLRQATEVVWDARTGQRTDTVLQESDWNTILDHVKVFLFDILRPG